MKLKNQNVYFFFILLIIIGAMAFWLVKPFFTSILFAIILSAVFQRPYKFFLKVTQGHKSISALIICFLVVSVVIVPIFLVIGLVALELNSFYQEISSSEGRYQEVVQITMANIQNSPIFSGFLDESTFDQKEIFDSLKSSVQGALSVIKAIYSSIARFLFWIFIMLFALYYFVMEGRDLAHKIIHLSPLKDAHEKMLIRKFISISKATLKGLAVIGVIQGTIGGITFALVGVPSPIVWAVIMIILSMIPLLGAGIVWFPVAIIMILLGNVWQGVVILLVGFGIISVLDNILRPKLVGRDSQIHPLLVFFATIGGIIVFGISGFIIGPIIMALFLALLDIYEGEFKEQLEVYNR